MIQRLCRRSADSAPNLSQRACRTLLCHATTVLSALLVAFALCGLVTQLHAQATTATISGTVVDDTGAVIPDAEATLRDVKSGSVRTSKSNGAGFFVFAAVPTGDYDVLVRRDGFKANSIHGIHLDPEDNKTLSQIKLEVGVATEVITVTTSDVGMINSGEKSTLLNSGEIKKLAVEGRDVGELVKILPGFAIAQTSGNIDNATYDPSQVNVSGALRSYAANGNSANGVTLLSDGANITDPGDFGDSMQNVNTDMVEEVKVQTSNFTAETSNGPIVVNAVGKSGGRDYHGEIYTYGRTYQMDSYDALAKYEGQAKPEDRYIYPGANLGGPIKIPGTDFNHNKKLTFFVGAEDYAQRNIYAYGNASSATLRALVPTATMRTGDFSCPTLQAYLGASAIACNTNGTSTILNATYNNVGQVPTQTSDGHTVGGGQIGSSFFDPGAKALLSLIPLPNRTNLGDGYNYVHTNLINNDLYQARLRIDDAISERTKLFGTYNVERGVAGVPQVPYYSPTGDQGGIDTPGGLNSTINSQTAGLNLLLVLSPSLTNEVVANLSYFYQAFEPNKQASLLASTIGYPYQGLIANGTKQYPQLHDYNYDGLPIGLFPDFSLGAPYAKKTIPSVGDNLTYVYKTHTIKAGGFLQKVTNNQVLLPSNSSTNGQIAAYYYGSTYTDPDGKTVYTSGNYAANFLEGQIEQFSQQNGNPQQNLYYWNINWYGTDSWKVSRRLTVDYGIRFEHLGPWEDAHGIGLTVYNPSLTAAESIAGFTGFGSHATDHAIPISGSPSRFAFYEPRVGAAYDLYGNGMTVLRGGWGAYRNHDSWNVVQPSAAFAEGARVTAITSGPGISLSQLSSAGSANAVTTGSASSSTYAMDPKDDEQPLTYTYSFTVSQQTPKKSQLEIGYVGNKGQYLTSQDVNSQALSLQNVNPVPLGAFFHPDPVTGAVVPLKAIDGLTTSQVNDYRPNPAYGDIYVPRHILYSYYNGLQTSWAKQSGRLNYAFNYTWSKALGIKDGYYNGNAADATNLRHNYGPLSFDRTSIFNASYSYDVGTHFGGSTLVRGLANGWAVSGITNVQSGPNLQATYYNNLNLIGHLGAPGSPTQLNVDNKTFLGTPDVALQPLITCNPAYHTAPHQFINGACFQLPQIGQNGPFQYPYLHGPAFFNSDLTLAKSFAMKEGRSLQFRFSAFNFLNHPLTTFTTSFPQQIQLNLSNLTPGGETASPSLATPQPGFGIAPIKEGRRVAEAAVKFNF